MSILIFILIISFLVLIHEFGHFIVAKRNGIRVEEFGLGLPPRLIGKKIGETIYSLNLLPFGGFVKLTGEDFEEEDTTAKDELAPEDSRSFASKTPIQRIKVLLAGVFMNILLAFVLFYIFFFIHDFKTSQIPMFFDFNFRFGEVITTGTVIASIEDNSAAAKAGLKIGEAILTVDGVRVNNTPELRTQLKNTYGKEVNLELKDLTNENRENIRFVKATPHVGPDGNPVLGVYLSKSALISYAKPWEKILAGPLHSYNVMDYSLDSLFNVIKLSIRTRQIAPVSESVSGPVGIYNLLDAILKYGGAQKFLTIIDYLALMSLSLAFVNVLPFPALDGGRALFILIELIRGKRINPNWEAMIHRVGMMFLLGFLVLVTLKDLFLK